MQDLILITKEIKGHVTDLGKSVHVPDFQADLGKSVHVPDFQACPRFQVY